MLWVLKRLRTRWCDTQDCICSELIPFEGFGQSALAQVNGSASYMVTKQKPHFMLNPPKYHGNHFVE